MSIVAIPRSNGVVLPRIGLADCLRTGWRATIRHYRMRRELIRLSRLPPRLVSDMGLDPERIYEALDGTWDAVGPAHLSSLLSRSEMR